MGFSFKGLFKGIGKQMGKAQESPIGKALRDFGKGAANAPEDASLGEVLAMGGSGAGMGYLGGKLAGKELPPVSKPKITPILVPQGAPRQLPPVEGIELDDDIMAKRRRNILNAIA